MGGAGAWLGYDGLLVPSAHAPGVNLVVFVNVEEPNLPSNLLAINPRVRTNPEPTDHESAGTDTLYQEFRALSPSDPKPDGRLVRWSRTGVPTMQFHLMSTDSVSATGGGLPCKEDMVEAAIMGRACGRTQRAHRAGLELRMKAKWISS